MRGNNLQKIMEKVQVTDNCWLWNGFVAPTGYGRVKIHYKFRHAHRVIYELLVEEISEDLVLDHLCRNRQCVNPNHLEPVTVKENIMRGVGLASINAKKTHCKRGHAFDEGNTYTLKNKRYCRICERAKTKRLRQQKRESSHVHA